MRLNKSILFFVTMQFTASGWVLLARLVSGELDDQGPIQLYFLFLISWPVLCIPIALILSRFRAFGSISAGLAVISCIASCGLVYAIGVELIPGRI
jgi:hypothetical protein